MRNVVWLVVVLGLGLGLAGCPQSDKRGSAGDLSHNLNPYQNVMPQKVKADVEAAHQREADRDDKRFDEAKQ